MNFKNLFNLYLESTSKNLAHSTLQGYQSMFAKVCQNIGNKDITTLKTLDLQKIINSYYQLSAKSINNYISFLQSVFKFAVNMQILKHSPADGLVRCKHVIKPIECLTGTQASKLIKYLIKQNQLVGLFYAVAFNTGMRTSELYGLRWQDINIHNKKITIEGAVVRGVRKATKTNKVRCIDVNNACIEHLIQLYSISREREYAFSTDTYNFTCNNAKSRVLLWYKALQLLNIPKIKPSATRHTYASIALSNGARPAWLALQLGHASINTTYKFYAKWINSDDNIKYANLINL